MTTTIRKTLAWLGSLIDGFQPAEGAPPRMLLALSSAGALPGRGRSSSWRRFLSGLAGVMEVGAAWLLGVLVDSTAAGSEGYFRKTSVSSSFTSCSTSRSGRFFFGTSAAFNGIVLPPNLSAADPEPVAPLVAGAFGDLLRQRFRGPHRAEADADGDRAGERGDRGHQCRRIRRRHADRSIVMLAAIDWRIGLALLLWLAGYIVMIRWFLPRIRVRSKDRAAARANVTGADRRHDHQHQDGQAVRPCRITRNEAAIDALQGYRQTALAFGYLSTSASAFALMATAGLLARDPRAGRPSCFGRTVRPRPRDRRRRARSPCASRR